MKPVQIRRPFVKVLEKSGMEISTIPKNMIDSYVRRIRKLLDEAIADWTEMKLYKSSDLDALAKGFVSTVLHTYAKRLKKELVEDVNV